MITADHAVLMAQYNRWQNRSLYTAADQLSEAQRREDKGAFFGSIHNTLAHVLWGDRAWMSRFAGTAPVRPEDRQGLGPAYQDWQALQRDRAEFDAVILDWSSTLSPDWLAGDFTWTNSAGTRTSTQKAWILVTHLFNHATHHRGQAHALLTSFGAKPDDTDIQFMPELNS
ncbi:MAG: DinB family protein [Pseudomonadota bacterium]